LTDDRDLAEALDEPFAFPSWFLRIICEAKNCQEVSGVSEDLVGQARGQGGAAGVSKGCRSILLDIHDDGG
jgi:hypothetical protein